MFGHKYYHETIRKYIIIFGTLFNEIFIYRTDSSGNKIQEIKVPLAYGPRDKTLARLEQAQTPTEMKAIAENMSNMAKLEKENAELKARLAPQQSFDTNTPTPAAATNEDRLLDAYLGGDRSEAASKAAAKLLGI